MAQCKWQLHPATPANVKYILLGYFLKTDFHIIINNRAETKNGIKNEFFTLRILIFLNENGLQRWVLIFVLHKEQTQL